MDACAQNPVGIRDVRVGKLGEGEGRLHAARRSGAT
jgi:hypothetical protein